MKQRFASLPEAKSRMARSITPISVLQPVLGPRKREKTSEMSLHALILVSSISFASDVHEPARLKKPRKT
ncbi:hypothetical protein D9M69_584200 [compost metagenome]